MSRLVAWGHEMRAVHQRLRQALDLTRDAVLDGRPTEPATRELLLYCHGFCTALVGHHEGEDRALFPEIRAARPELAEVVRKLEQDHSMINHLLTGLQAAVDRSASPEELDRHLEGIAAIMESHFRYEERELLSLLDALAWAADPAEVFGPL